VVNYFVTLALSVLICGYFFDDQSYVEIPIRCKSLGEVGARLLDKFNMIRKKLFRKNFKITFLFHIYNKYLKFCGAKITRKCRNTLIIFNKKQRAETVENIIYC